MKRKLLAIVIPAACLALRAQKPAGVYTPEQAKRGADAYAAKCAMCHGGEMQGGPEAPTMVGGEFLFSWGGKTAGALYEYIRANMPPNEQSSLSDQRRADLLAAIFQKNNFPAGPTELPPDPAVLAKIVIPKE